MGLERHNLKKTKQITILVNYKRKKNNNPNLLLGNKIVSLLTKSSTPDTSHWLMSNVKLDIPWNNLFIDLFDGLLVSKRHLTGGLEG